MSEPPITPGTFDLHLLPTMIGKHDPVILDVGCNDGTHTIAFLKLFPLSKIFAFEPDPRALESFRKSIKGDRVQLFDIALSDRDGETDFYPSDGYPTSPEWKDYRPNGWDLSGSIKKPKEHLHVFPWCEFNRTTQVKTRRLDSWASEIGIDVIDLIWADVQGAEQNLIEGGRETLSKTRFFYTEYSNDELYEGQVSLNWILEALPEFDVVTRFSDDVLLRNRDLS